MNFLETIEQEQKIREEVAKIKEETKLDRFPDKIDQIHHDSLKYKEN